MDFKFAEMPCEGDLLRPRQRLIAKEQHATIEQRGADGGYVFGYIGPGEIEIRDLGTDRGCQGADVERRRFARDGHGRHQAACLSSSSSRSQTSVSAPTSSSIMAGVCAGPGVKRRRSVPRGTVGKLIGCT